MEAPCVHKWSDDRWADLGLSENIRLVSDQSSSAIALVNSTMNDVRLGDERRVCDCDCDCGTVQKVTWKLESGLTYQSPEQSRPD